MARAAIFGCLGPHLSAAEAAFFREADPWGFILFARNVDDPDQLRRLTGDLRDAVGRGDAPVFIDQEGGRVARMRGPHWHEWVPPLEEREEALRARYRVIGAELRAVGITGNCAPVLDIARAETHAILRNRCLGADAEAVARRGRIVADAHLSVGVLPVIKHMPGQGRADLDSHVDLPRVTSGLEVLRTEDFAPFRALADLPMAMTSHVVFDALDDAPTTFSGTVIAEMRDGIGFDGLIVTDDLSMGALSGTYGERTARALGAGCDVILHCNGAPEQMQAVAGHLPLLTGSRFDRAQAALSCGKPQDVVDMAHELAQYGALTQE